MSLLNYSNKVDISDDFKTNILAKFREYTVGDLCRTDETIVRIGSVFYRKIKRKTDKAIQVRRTVRMEMRRLGNLYLTFTKENVISTYNNAKDMFLRNNFNSLRNAIEIYSTTSVGKLKPGLKQNLLFLLKRSAKALKAILMADGKDTESSEIERFMQVLELWEDYIFGDAQYELNKRRQVNLRRPEKLPNEEDIQLVCAYVMSKMKNITDDPYLLVDSHCFVELRNCACSRLTLLNARRGGEPARLTIEEWNDAKENKWIDQQRLKDLDEVDQMLIKNIKVTYLTGKGNNHLVPLLVPEDTVAALEKLSCKDFRRESGISETNNYLFASTRNSEDHISVWHSLYNITEKLPLKDPANMKSTSNRHHLSTIFAAFDISKADREYFYKHMGHSAAINEQIYQAPLAMMEVTKIGKRLLDIDKGRIFYLLTYPVGKKTCSKAAVTTLERCSNVMTAVFEHAFAGWEYLLWQNLLQLP